MYDYEISNGCEYHSHSLPGTQHLHPDRTYHIVTHSQAGIGLRKRSIIMKRSVFLLFVFIIIVSLTGTKPQNVHAAEPLYASPGGDPTGATCPITTPCTIQRALAIAASGDTIYLQSGTYIRENEADLRVLWITKSITLVGSCDFSSGSAVCSPNNARSILNGETERRVIFIQAGGKDVVINSVDIINGNSYEITEGGCGSVGSYTTKGCGGGMHASGLSSLVLRDMSFSHNSAALESSGTAVAGFGGGLITYLTNTIGIYDCTFDQNSATFEGYGTGGAIFIATAANEVNIEDSLFTENSCSSNMDEGNGCAIHASTSNVLNFTRNTFNGNNPFSTLFIEGSAIYVLNHNDFNLLGNSFTNHYGDLVIDVHKNLLTEPVDTIHENRFWNNYVTDAINISGKFLTNISNNFFGYGEVLRMEERGGPKRSGITLDATALSNTDIYHNTFAKLDYGINVGSYIDLAIKNNIFAYTWTKAVNIYGNFGTKDVNNNLFYSNLAIGDITDLNMVTTNPYLVSVSTGDFHIQSNSGAKDHGLNLGYSRDVDGQKRPLGIPDIGADEYMLQTFMPAVFR